MTSVKHLDETGGCIQGRTRWLYLPCIPLLIVLRIGIGPGDVERNVTDIFVHDDNASDFTLEGVRHAACNAHHPRELQASINIEMEDRARSIHCLLERAGSAAPIARETC